MGAGAGAGSLQLRITPTNASTINATTTAAKPNRSTRRRTPTYAERTTLRRLWHGRHRYSPSTFFVLGFPSSAAPHDLHTRSTRSGPLLALTPDDGSPDGCSSESGAGSSRGSRDTAGTFAP